jgi:hypothetical protein
MPMNTGFVLILLVSLIIPASEQSWGSSGEFQVSEITRILSGNSFECKLSDYPHSKAVRFRVFVRDIELQTAEESAKEQLSALFDSAKRVQLQGVKFRNYFRVEADLFVNGLRIADSKDTVETVVEQPQRQQDTASARRMWQQRRFPAPLQGEKPPSASSRPVNVDVLLNTSVDASMLLPETSFAEALDLLTHAVDPPLPLIVLWTDLRENALVDKDTPIGIDGLPRMKLKQALTIILDSVGNRGSKLMLVSESTILKLATEQTFQNTKRTKVYPIEDLLSLPSNTAW